MKIPKRFGIMWDGDYKAYTKDCLECGWYRKIDDRELCGWGIAFKYLVKLEKLRTCEVRNRKDKPKHPSIKYLNKLVN